MLSKEKQIVYEYLHFVSLANVEHRLAFLKLDD